MRVKPRTSTLPLCFLAALLLPACGERAEKPEPDLSAGPWKPTSKMRQTFGWVTLRARWISRLNRSTAEASLAAPGWIVLSATRPRSSMSSAS